MTTDRELTQEEQNEENESALKAGYAKVKGMFGIKHGDDDKQLETEDSTQGNDETPKEDAKAETDSVNKDDSVENDSKPSGDAETEKDPWEGVPAIVKEQLTALSSVPGKVRNLEGRYGTLNRDVRAAQQQATNDTNDSGGKAPTQEEIDAAAKSSEQWDKLKDEYPEWTTAFDGKLSLLEKRLEGKIPAFNKDELGNEIRTTVKEDIQASNASIRELVKIDNRYPEWEDTINTPDYSKWLFEGGPTAEDFAQYKGLEQTDPGQANRALNEIIRLHPKWWSEKGSKIFSDRAKDAIALLDGYTSAQDAESNEDDKNHSDGDKNLKNETETPPKDTSANSRRESNRRRLESATVPKGSGGPKDAAISDDDAFKAGHKKVSDSRRY